MVIKLNEGEHFAIDMVLKYIINVLYKTDNSQMYSDSRKILYRYKKFYMFDLIKDIFKIVMLLKRVTANMHVLMFLLNLVWGNINIRNN